MRETASREYDIPGTTRRRVADQLCALKEAHPKYSVALLIATARAQQR